MATAQVLQIMMLLYSPSFSPLALLSFQGVSAGTHCVSTTLSDICVVSVAGGENEISQMMVRPLCRRFHLEWEALAGSYGSKTNTHITRGTRTHSTWYTHTHKQTHHTPKRTQRTGEG